MTRWWTITKWMIKAGVAVWFVALPLIAIYGWLRPWPQAEEALRRAGVSGALVMIGSGSDSNHIWSTAGHTWQEDIQRSFVAIPESFSGAKLFTYFEARGSSIEGTKTGVVTSPMLIPLLGMWIVAGVFSMRTLRQLRNKQRRKS